MARLLTASFETDIGRADRIEPGRFEARSRFTASARRRRRWSGARSETRILPRMLGRLRRQKRTRRALILERANRPVAILGDLDQAALRVLRTRWHGRFSDAVMKGLGFSGEYGAVWFAIGAAGAASDPRRRSRWAAAAFVAPTAVVLNFAVKRTIGRQRPVITDHPPLARAPSKLSFPSAHATSSLAGAGALARVAPRAGLPLHVLAGAICVGRPYLGMHYPSDVLAGAALGAVIGRVAPLPRERRAPAPMGDGASPTGSDRETEPARSADLAAASGSPGTGRNSTS
ncbi:MAG TPA: phosphatase PAP2 family protein [Solirubrobacterales bacterium]|nr:phosphatase PAP2 family protein [Solirubrobacterales bacterium]